MEKNHEVRKETGLIQIYTGNGKGKSTAAFGLALRAMGSGLRVVIIQFMKKGEWYGEINAFAQLPKIEVFSFGGHGFLKKGQPPGADHLAQAQNALNKAGEIMMDNWADMLILDELTNALYFELITEEEARALLALKPPHIELVITGRYAPDYLMESADLITEMVEIRHPYRLGITARRGIEY